LRRILAFIIVAWFTTMPSLPQALTLRDKPVPEIFARRHKTNKAKASKFRGALFGEILMFSHRVLPADTDRAFGFTVG